MIIKKAEWISGRKLSFRNAVVDDADFILSLRTNTLKSQHLSYTSNVLADQQAWLKKYEVDNSQAYFIIENMERSPVGTVRLYDAIGDSFCWGSWIKVDNAPPGFAMESAMMVYAYAISLGFLRSHFDVRVNNSSVCSFHERLGAVVTHSTGIDNFYLMDTAAIRELGDKYKKYLPDGISVGRTF